MRAAGTAVLAPDDTPVLEPRKWAGNRLLRCFSQTGWIPLAEARVLCRLTKVSDYAYEGRLIRRIGRGHEDTGVFRKVMRVGE
jgi:hypothetical protein